MSEEVLVFSPTIVVTSPPVEQPRELPDASTCLPSIAVTCNVYFNIYYPSSCQMLCGCDECLYLTKYVDQLPFIDDGYKIVRIFPVGTNVTYVGCEHEPVEPCDWCARQ